jgi:hypothetical protein
VDFGDYVLSYVHDKYGRLFLFFMGRQEKGGIWFYAWDVWLEDYVFCENDDIV